VLRLAVRAILISSLALTLLPADAHAQRYAYLVQDIHGGAAGGRRLLVFDATTGASVTEVQLTEGGLSWATSDSNSMAISPEGRRAYITFGSRILVVDLTNNTVLGQFSGVNIARYPVVSMDGQRLYVLNHVGAGVVEVKVLSTVTGATLATHPLAGDNTTSDLSLTPDESTAVVRTSTGIAVLTLATGAVRTLTLGTLIDVIVHPDNTRAFTLTSGGDLSEVSLSSMQVTRAGTVTAQFANFQMLSMSPEGAYLYVGQAGNTLFSGTVQEVEIGSLTVSRSLGGGAFVRASPTGLQLATIGNSTGTSFAALVSIQSTIGQSAISLGAYDRTTQTIRDFAIGPNLSCIMSPPAPASASFTSTGGTGTITVPAPTGCAWTATSNQSFVTITAGHGGHSAGTVSYTVAASALATSRSATITIAGRTVTITQDANPNTLSASPTSLRFAAHRNFSTIDYTLTPAQRVTVFATGTVTSWTASANQPWVAINNGTGSGAGQFTVGITESLMDTLTGTQTATITITAPGHTATVPVTLVIDAANGVSAHPFGQVDTPGQDATGVTGAFSLSGWVLDDVGVTMVKVYRDCLPSEINVHGCFSPGGLRGLRNVIELGDATIVPGARPDVEALYPTYPAANRAGWGFMILSNMLPNVAAGTPQGGVGQVTVHVLAFSDYPGVTRLGRAVLDETGTRITLANDTIAKPFGAIDTPAQGATVAGTLNNFGWALTPDPGTGVLIPTSGSTINVFIDGASIGTATYNLCRGTVGNPVPSGVLCDDDVSTIFRGNGARFRNLDAGRGPIGLRSINTTALANGLHTISWGVTDSANRSEGIGSRYFTVLSSSADVGRPALEGRQNRGVQNHAALLPSAIYARTGFDVLSAYAPLVPDASGVPQVRIPELGRVELQIPGVTSGAMLVNDELRPLPIGVGIDHERGIVSWIPGVGYLGTYRLQFGPTVVDVTVAPASTTDEPLRLHLDSPTHGLVLSERAVRVEGWALDPQAASGAGVGAVHVWGRRVVHGPTGAMVQGSEPVFLGVADINIPRPDVAAAHGERFPDAGFRLHASLPAGEWEVTAYVWVARTGRFEDARSVRVVTK